MTRDTVRDTITQRAGSRVESAPWVMLADLRCCPARGQGFPASGQVIHRLLAQAAVEQPHRFRGDPAEVVSRAAILAHSRHIVRLVNAEIRHARVSGREVLIAVCEPDAPISFTTTDTAAPVLTSTAVVLDLPHLRRIPISLSEPDTIA